MTGGRAQWPTEPNPWNHLASYKSTPFPFIFLGEMGSHKLGFATVGEWYKLKMILLVDFNLRIKVRAFLNALDSMLKKKVWQKRLELMVVGELRSLLD